MFYSLRIEIHHDTLPKQLVLLAKAKNAKIKYIGNVGRNMYNETQSKHIFWFVIGAGKEFDGIFDGIYILIKKYIK